MPFIAPTPLGAEVMTFAHLRAMAPSGYLALPQRPAFHLLILTTAGEGAHTVDFQRYRLAPGRTAWVRPGQVQRFGDHATAGFGDDATAGDLVLFEPDFLIPGTQAAAIADDRLGPVTLSHPPPARPAIDRARRALRQEYANTATGRQAITATQAETLRHLLSILVLRLSRDAPDTPRDDRSDLYARFRDLVERDFAMAHDVSHYAHALGYSNRTLTRAAQAVAGETPKQAIQDRLALEARRLLAHTDLPIATIAAQLGFRDASNFSTFFAHQTSRTPTTFRHEQRPSPHRTPTAPRP